MQKKDIAGAPSCSLERLHAIMLATLKAVDGVCRRRNLRYFLMDGTLLGAVRHGGFIPWDDDVDIAMPREDFEVFKAVAQAELGPDYFVQTMETDPAYRLYYIPLKVRDNHSTLVEQYGQNYHQGVYVDVFPLDALTENEARERKQKRTIYLFNVVKGPFRRDGFPSPKFFLRALLQLMGRLIPTALILRYIEKAKSANQRGVRSGRWTYGFETPWRKVFDGEDLFPLTEGEFAGERFFLPRRPDKVLETLFGDYMTLPPESERHTHAKFYSDERLF